MLRRRPWLIVVLGLFSIVGVLIAAGAAYWQYANFVPEYPRPVVAMPVPNAYDDYVRAGTMCEAAGGATVLPASPARALGLPPLPPGAPVGAPVPPDPSFPGAPVGSAAFPGSPQGVPREGYEPDVPLAQVRAVLARNRPALARLRQGFGKACRTPPVLSNMQTFPELSGFRALARVLVTEGKLAEREGRMADAARSYLDCLRLGVDVPRGGLLLHGLVGIAVQAIGLKALGEGVDQLDTPVALMATREMLRLDQYAPGAAEVLQGEKEYGTQSMVEVFRQGLDWQQFRQMAGSSGLAAGPGVLYALKFSFTPKKRMLDDFRTSMDAVIADARKPYYAPSSLPPMPNDPLSQMLLPSFSGSKWLWARRDAYWRIVELRLAARAYQTRHGAPPPSAEALVPEYLPAVPRDPFADKPLVYRVKGNRAIVYSRGPDGDDDGGLDLGWKAQRDSNGDLVSLGGRPRVPNG